MIPMMRKLKDSNVRVRVVDSMIAEKRLTRRFPGRIGIITSDTEGLNFGFITDLSRDGAYIETEKLLPIGAMFQFVLSNGYANASVPSKVVRTRDAFFHGGRSGIGIQFESLQLTGKALRDDLLLFLMNQRYHSVWERH